MISFAPLIITLTVPSIPAPPTNPPTTAPNIKLYTGCTFLMINTMATTSPSKAPNVVICTSIIVTPI